jgi:hypothetical protein
MVFLLTRHPTEEAACPVLMEASKGTRSSQSPTESEPTRVAPAHGAMRCWQGSQGILPTTKGCHGDNNNALT